jgi:hypothetical protein
MAKTNYFQSFENYFWQWEELGEVVSIPNGSTIAYKAFLKEIIPVISIQGLPPFGALLLAIIATNANGKQILSELDSRMMDDDGHLKREKLKATDFLNLLASVPEEFKKGTKKIQLFLAVFEKCHGVISIKKSQEIIRMISSPDGWDDSLTPVPYHKHILLQDLRVFSVLSSKLTTVQQILDKVANLPDLSDFFELLEPAVEEGAIVPTDFVDELIANNRTHPVGTLIKHLWGGLTIPVHSSLPSSQPLGGISDLTNKGDFDKLLVSEFANDDLVFLSRLANNEALFIQREIPPQQNDLERIILIDSSLKNWGTPKTLAFAIMLAISKHPKTDIPCRSFVLGDTYKEVNSDSISSLIDALSILDAKLNAVNGLTSYLSDFPANKNQEIFVITEESTIKQPAMLKAVNEFHHAVAYWIYTDALGNIDVYKKQQHSKRLLQHIRLPLEDLWKKESSKQKVSRGVFQGDYPILFYPVGSYEQVPSADGLNCFLVSNDRKLFRFFEDISFTELTNYNKKGLELVWDKIPVASEYEMGFDSSNNQILACVDVYENRISLYNLTTRKEQKAFFDKNSITKGGLHFHERLFRYRSSKGNWIINPDNGEVTKDLSQSYESKADLKEVKQAVLMRVPSILTNRNILKNIVTIAVSEQHNLIFNSHELRFNHSSSTIKITNRKNIRKVIESIESDPNQFTFADGSTIEVNQSGMFILKSSNPSIPLIFVPSVLETKLGIATKSAFCGDDFFKKTEEESISTNEFFDRFVNPFLKNIESYGA